jgi:hypothetical protein
MGLKTNELIEGEVDDNGRPYTRPGLQKSIGEQLWDRLDLLMDDFKESGDQTAQLVLKAQMREIGFALHLMMRPHYEDVTAIAKEAAKRWRIRQGIQPFEETPGYQFNPPPPGTKAYERGVMQEDAPQVEKASTRRTRKPKGTTLSEQDKQAVKMAARSGSFEIELIAKTYSITVAEVERLRNEE